LESLVWLRYREQYEREEGKVFYTCKEFNGCKYYLYVSVYENNKSDKFWISISSGKKRKDLHIFEEKENKSTGGLKALVWIKKSMLEFPNFYNRKNNSKKKQYICVSWADSRRRNIYQRLIKDGFSFSIDDGEKILIKKL
jgi:hypothetical protein